MILFLERNHQLESLVSTLSSSRGTKRVCLAKAWLSISNIRLCRSRKRRLINALDSLLKLVFMALSSVEFACVILICNGTTQSCSDAIAVTIIRGDCIER